MVCLINCIEPIEVEERQTHGRGDIVNLLNEEADATGGESERCQTGFQRSVNVQEPKELTEDIPHVEVAEVREASYSCGTEDAVLYRTVDNLAHLEAYDGQFNPDAPCSRRSKPTKGRDKNIKALQGEQCVLGIEGPVEEFLDVRFRLAVAGSHLFSFLFYL